MPKQIVPHGLTPPDFETQARAYFFAAREKETRELDVLIAFMHEQNPEAVYTNSAVIRSNSPSLGYGGWLRTDASGAISQAYIAGYIDSQLYDDKLRRPKKFKLTPAGKEYYEKNIKPALDAHLAEKRIALDGKSPQQLIEECIIAILGEAEHPISRTMLIREAYSEMDDNWTRVTSYQIGDVIHDLEKRGFFTLTGTKGAGIGYTLSEAARNTQTLPPAEREAAVAAAQAERRFTIREIQAAIGADVDWKSPAYDRIMKRLQGKDGETPCR